MAKDEIDDTAFDVQSFLDDSNTASTLSINEANTKYQNHLEQMKFFAVQDRLNMVLVAQCLEGREDELNNLPTVYFGSLNSCIGSSAKEALQIKEDGTYKVDIIMSEVYQLEFKLLKCEASDENCYSDVISSINSQIEALPVKIQSEVVKVNEASEILKGKITDCSDDHVAGFTAKGVSLINEIAHCINTI